MTEFIDLSYPIRDKAPCTFSTADKVPIVTFEEGDSHGTFFVTSRIENLYSNAGTQVDFPGHLSRIAGPGELVHPTHPTVGEYPLERFIGSVAILNFSHKTALLDDWFDARGLFRRERLVEFAIFVEDLRGLEITADELVEAANSADVSIDQLRGVILYSGCGAYWTYETFESWEYRYFYGPYFSRAAVDILLDARISFVGVDAFQIENPIANFRGDELPLVVNPDARTLMRSRLEEWKFDTNHEWLLGRGILIYESLRLPSVVAGRTGYFSGPPLNLQLPGLDDDAVVRPYLVLERR